MWVGPTSERELERIIRARRPARRNLRAGCKALRDKYADLIRARFPEDQAPRLRLQPRPAAAGERLQRRARAGGHRGHLRADAAGAGRGWCTARRRRVLLVLGFADIYRAGDAVPQILAVRARSPPKAWTSASSAACASAACSCDDIALLPAGNAWIMIEFGADTRRAAQRHRRRRSSIRTRAGRTRPSSG